MKLHPRTVQLINLADFLAYFKDLLPEYVDEDAFNDAISESEVSFGTNTDTLITLHEGLTFLKQATDDDQHMAIVERFDRLYEELEDQYDMEEVFLSLGC